MPDPYKTLGVKTDADLADIKKAYKNLAKKLHPDKTGANLRALEQMKIVNEAYATLCKNLQKEAESDHDLSAKYVEEVWKTYSKQVEEYYQQVQNYLQDKLVEIQGERSRLSRIEMDLVKREKIIAGKEKTLGRVEADKKRLSDIDGRLKKREDVIAAREAQLDELLLCISRANAITVEIAQSSRSIRKSRK